MRLAKFARWIELALVLLAAGLLAVYGFIHGGQIAGTDTLYYLDTALKGSSEPFILNRYTHVFLLTLFTTVAGSPLAGMQVYSAAAFASGFLLVYSCARYLTSNSGPANGTIAVGLFFGLPVAQPGSAPAWGAGGRRFKSARPDQRPSNAFDGLSTLSGGLSNIRAARQALSRNRVI